MAFIPFTQLKVYRLAEELSSKIWKMVLSWDLFFRNTIGKQLVNACESIGANIAEGHGRGYSAENKRFIRIARGSLNETRHFLRRSHSLQLMNEHEVKEIKKIIDSLNPSLNRYLNSITDDSTKMKQKN